MRLTATYQLENVEQFKNQVCLWASQFKHAAVLLGNTESTQGKYLEYDMLVGVGALSEIIPKFQSFNALEDFHLQKKDWIFGFLSYDLKNELENLSSSNSDVLQFPNMHFFQPKWVISIKKNTVQIHFLDSLKRKEIHQLFGEIMQFKHDDYNSHVPNLQTKLTKKDYLQTIEKLQVHIQKGDIYEINFCQEYFAEKTTLNPVTIFNNLYAISEPPFACYYRYEDCHLMSASPERFLKKESQKLISQPIKGTRKRGGSVEEDNQLKKELLDCPKERSENVMIVDLVRNDLSRTASFGSVKVEELFGIYSFKQVHQMISTITSNLKENVSGVEAIRCAFPMGSMTGAPKIRAMELIEEYESTKRGLYSGSVGYFTPQGDFDFNVVIRSILYNAKNKYASFMVGGAITAKSIPEQEYEECLVKAKAMFEVLGDD